MVAALTLAAAAISHHLTSYALVVFLVLWAVIRFGLRLRGEGAGQPDPTGMAALGVILCLGWLVYIANIVVGYLAPQVVSSLTEIISLMRGELASKPLFRDPTGQVTPIWERAAAISSTVLILLGLPLGLLQVWRHHQRSAVVLALALVGAVFPATLRLPPDPRRGRAVRPGGGHPLHRRRLRPLPRGRLAPRARGGARSNFALCLALLTVFFVGEIVVGAGPIWARVPGPYLVGGDNRSIEAEGLAAATWARVWLGPDNRFAADRTNRLLLGSEGSSTRSPQRRGRCLAALRPPATVHSGGDRPAREHPLCPG